MADENGDDAPVLVEEDSDQDSSSESGSGSESESQEEPTELLVNTREKRSTAGNRLASLLQQEDPDDELELLFAEADDDAGFEDDEANSDVQMDSSDDDEDQGPTAGADDLDGEKELQKKERAEKLKKRKANDGLPKGFKKKVKIDPTATSASFPSAAPRPKKKSERASWLPTVEDAPTRASARGTTRQSKEQLHAQMVDREIKRLKQLENMEKAAARKEAAKKPALTQADRLAEAARIEKKNSKSLSRWEEAEQQREEEQAAKLAALSNRQLSGPVITWWSGKAEWVGGVLKKVGKTLELEDPIEKKNRKRKAAEMEAESAATSKDAPEIPSINTAEIKDAPESPKPPTAVPSRSEEPSQNNEPKSATGTPAPMPPNNNVIPQNIRTASPLMAPPINPPVPPPQPQIPAAMSISPTLAPPPPSYPNPPFTTSSSPRPPTPSQTTTKPSHPPFILAPPQQWHPLPQYQPRHLPFDGSAPLPGFGPPPLPRLMPSHTIPFGFTSQNHLNQQAPPPPPPPPPPPVPAGPPPIEHAARNCLILSNFDEDQIKDSNVQMQIVFGRKFVKAASTSQFPMLLALLTSSRKKERSRALCHHFISSKVSRSFNGSTLF